MNTQCLIKKKRTLCELKTCQVQGGLIWIDLHFLDYLS